MREVDKMRKEISTRNYRKENFIDNFFDFRKITFNNISVPKTPISCKECEKKHKKGNMKPLCFVIKDRQYVEPYNIFICCKCSTCNHVLYIRYSDYLEQTSFSSSKKRSQKDKDARQLEIIEQVYNCDKEKAIEIQKEEKERNRKLLRRMETERQIRLDSYEERDRVQKSAEKKALIESGELLYDKKNRVFYYKSTGKVYR